MTEKLAGIITMSDIARAVENRPALTTKVSEVMTTDVVEAPSDTKLFEVIKQVQGTGRSGD